MPPQVADTMTTTKSDINLHIKLIIALRGYISQKVAFDSMHFRIQKLSSNLKSSWSTGYFDLRLDIIKTLS